ncbi:MAG: GNAT family N-acetyltransferase [Hyphomicrobium sp.]
MTEAYPLRPFMPADTTALRDLFAQSIEELTQEDYTDEQRLAWIAEGEDAFAFAQRLQKMVTLIVQLEGDYAGFAALKDNTHVDMLYVHPYCVGQGVGSALLDALERIAAARGAKEMTVEASDTAKVFFESRGYVATQRNSVPIADLWLTNTTMKKQLAATNDNRPAPQ